MNDTILATGLMSGSSLDGTDLACCRFQSRQGAWTFTILAAETQPYPVPLFKKLEQAARWDKPRIGELDIELGRYYGEITRKFHGKHGLRPDLVASHGHTLFHEPDKGITLQLGDGSTLAAACGITVVNDFRSEDVRQGGQGAPLVPAGDRLLFGGFGACLNLGGFANISFDSPHGRRIAYDIGPANIALNRIAGKAGKVFDRNGAMARSGTVDEELLQQLNAVEYYRRKPPKSLGREWFERCFAPFLEDSTLENPDLMATVCEHIALQTGRALNDAGAGTVLVSGGGALNHALMERIRHATGSGIHVPEKELVLFKEALVFALLGVLRLRGEVNCLASATGGASDLSAGTIHRPL